MEKVAPRGEFSSDEEQFRFKQKYADFLTYSCGYISASNGIFSNYIGREDEFQETFGFPMYTINSVTGIVDYNYEKLELQFFNYVNGDKIKDIIKSDDYVFANGRVEDTKGNVIYLGYDMKDYENFLKDRGVNCQTQTIPIVTNRTNQNEKGINKELRRAYLDNDCIILTAGGYDLYDENGNLFYEGGGGHSMQLVGFTDDGKPIVSSWGRKFVADLNGEKGGNNDVEYLDLYYTAVNYD